MLGAKAAGRVLVVDDDEDVLTSARLVLTRADFEVTLARRPEEALAALSAAPVDVVLLDLNFSRGATSGEEGLACLRAILEDDPDAVVVVVTGHSGVVIAVTAMRAGAADFVTKPWRNERLVATVRTAVEMRRSRRSAQALRAENAALASAAGADGDILGRSPAMTRLRELIRLTGPTDANVLVLGENGVGKELVARALHRASARADGPFISVDLGAVPEPLLESELFGHKAGAVPDARIDRAGRFVSAQGGTLFLDEIGNLPLPAQVKLLSALERRQITPLGADRPTPVDVRIVAATNLDRASLYSEQVFRADLLYRLNTIELEVPPLRDRGEDVIELAQHYVAAYARKYGRPDKPLSDEAKAALRAERWRGNVRALRHAAERAVILSEGESYGPRDFGVEAPGPAAPAPTGTLNLVQSERSLVEQALQKHHYNISHAARDLGLTRAALYRRMAKHGL